MAIPVSPSSENLLTLLQQAQNLNAASQDAWIEDEDGAGVGPTASGGWDFAHPTKVQQNEIQARFEQKFLKRIAVQYSQECPGFDLSDPIPYLNDAVGNIVDDDFTRCFESKNTVSWNFNAYLFPVWLLGIVVRYFLMFPLRLIALLVIGCTAVTCFLLAPVLFPRDMPGRLWWQVGCVRWVARAFTVSWTGVIRYHGHRPARKANQVYVANHTSLIDVAVLYADHVYALIGQGHPGFVGFLQNKILSCLGCVWFERSQSKDRAHVARAVKAHIANPENNPLLIFPEGTCVNNEYIVMFKKGAFELDAAVVPIAIKYNKLFADAFWNSRKQSFFRHLYHLMTRWAVVADVYYLPEETRQEGESALQFANRVKNLIARKIHLTEIPFDGYMKYVIRSDKFRSHQQKIFAHALMLRFRKFKEREAKERRRRHRVRRRENVSGLALALNKPRSRRNSCPELLHNDDMHYINTPMYDVGTPLDFYKVVDFINNDTGSGRPSSGGDAGGAPAGGGGIVTSASGVNLSSSAQLLRRRQLQSS